MASRSGPASRSYFSQRLRLHYADWGNADKPPLLLIHGGRDHCRSWDWVAEHFTDDYHVIAPDLRGHGDSEWTKGSAYAFYEFVYDIDENWKCIPRPLGVGLDNLSPELPSGLLVSLRYIEQGPRARQLALTYQSASPLEELSDEVLENAAIELCIVHGDLILADRRRYYEQLEAGLVSIGFVQSDDRGIELERRVLFGVTEDTCNTGLSPTLADAIRETVAGGS